MPTATDLVTDLPADFEVFGQAVDTRLKALNPATTLGDITYASATANTNTRLGIGTSGQVLAVSGGGVPAWTTTADVTPLTTKGDLFTFTTVDARIGVGANGTVLTADSAEATGLKWATPAGGGKVLQVVNATTTTETTIASTSYTDTTLTATITPTSATSKILVILNTPIKTNRSAESTNNIGVQLLRGASTLFTNGVVSGFTATGSGGTVVSLQDNYSMNYYDSPATTSATTYKLQGRISSTANSANAVFQYDYQTATITLMEIGA